MATINGGWRVAVLVLAAAQAGMGASVDFTVDTSRLTRLSSTMINFQLIDGDGTGDGNNTVRIRNFAGLGPVRGAPILSGGASGDVTSEIVLTDSSFFNEFLQFAGIRDTLSFTVEYTTNVDAGPGPDGFSFAILQQGLEIPTSALYQRGSDVFLTIDFNSATPTVSRFDLDYGRYALTVPEPASLFTAGLGLAIGMRKWRRRPTAEAGDASASC